MSGGYLTRQDDEALLTILDLSAHEGLSASQIARRIGSTKNAVIGALNRIAKEADKVPDRCRRKANKDGGMPRRWWAQ